MPRTRWVTPVRAVVLLLAVGCGAGDEGAKPHEVPATVPLTLPSTTERILGDPEPVEPEPEVPPATAATTTTLATGLPSGLGVPGAGNLALGSGSSISNGFTVREVPFFEVVAFVERELAALGWSVQAVPLGEPGQVVFELVGPGAIGQALVAPNPDGTVEVSLVLQGG